MLLLVRTLVSALLALGAAPLLHLVPFVPPAVDRWIAAVLDGTQPPPLVSSASLRARGGALFNPEGYHGPASSSTVSRLAPPPFFPPLSALPPPARPDSTPLSPSERVREGRVL